METTVTLTTDEAIVLLDWLSRHDDAEDLPHDDAEQRVLWNLAATLEKAIAETFDPDYGHLVAAARQRILER